MTDTRPLFRFCACCPAPCRSVLGTADELQHESRTPSSLSLIALAVIDGQLPWDGASRAALVRTEAAHACARACPYGHDVSAAIDAFVAQRGAAHEPGVPGN
ncbi:MAG: hypothetical protein KA224_00895 [Steroidobacteraceae bacterium]|nr:hypothetical protein [Steroidobacteraceae bacterium]